VLAIWLIAFVLWGVVTFIIRSDRTPDRLGTLGFDVCDDTLYFGNIRPGMRWAMLEHPPNTSSDGGNYLVITREQLTLPIGVLAFSR
jgi:hypothetical protein